MFRHNAFENIKALAPYFHEVWYQTLDYEYAEGALSRGFPAFGGLCSSMRKGGFLGRNFDWLFNESTEFVVHTPSKCGRFATIGTAVCVDGLTESFVRSGAYHENYRLLPFLIVDGMNEKGFAVNANVVPSGDKGVNMEILPSGDIEERVNAFMLIRFILDRFSTVADAVAYIIEHVAVYFPESFVRGHGYELHFMLSDKSESVVLEFVNGSYNVIPVGPERELPAVMTNFHLSGVRLNPEADRRIIGHVYTPQTAGTIYGPSRYNLITPNGAGLERYNALASRLPGVTDIADSMCIAMLTARFSKAYDKDPAVPWHTDFVGAPVKAGSTRKTTVESRPSDFEYSMGVAREWYGEDMKDPVGGRSRARVW